MIRVSINADSRYPVDRPLIRQAVVDTLRVYGMDDQPTVVDVSVVGARKMRALNKTYRHIDESTDVLAFPLDNASTLADGVVHLGDVVVNFPEARSVGIRMNRLVDRVIADLVVHGVKHLVGDHHE